MNETNPNQKTVRVEKERCDKTMKGFLRCF